MCNLNEPYYVPLLTVYLNTLPKEQTQHQPEMLTVYLLLTTGLKNQILAYPIGKIVVDKFSFGFNIASFHKPSSRSGERVSQWNENYEVNPEELGDYFQGDIMLSKSARTGIISSSARWCDGVVPYVIEGPYTEEEQLTIFTAMHQYHAFTCIRFRRKIESDVDFINIKNTGTGCWSKVGRAGGQQDLNLQAPGCLRMLGTAMHELMHALGFFHEQTRPDRDDYVEIVWQNIVPGREANFMKLSEDIVSSFCVDYDYWSVMHYSKKAFSKNKEPTIITKESVKIGQRKGFSEGDIRKLNEMYRCPSVDLDRITTEYPKFQIFATPPIDEATDSPTTILD